MLCVLFNFSPCRCWPASWTAWPTKRRALLPPFNAPSEIYFYILPVPQVLACILDGLADEAEGVRDAALAAGRVAVELYATTALPLLLPAVEAAIMSHNW